MGCCSRWSFYSVSLSADGMRVAIGAMLIDGHGSNSGHVRIYDWNETTWNQLAILKRETESLD
eukprot:scaffold15536_cov55-Attheya_sp.AAC.3